jgi:hypothetical protein
VLIFLNLIPMLAEQPSESAFVSNDAQQLKSGSRVATT